MKKMIVCNHKMFLTHDEAIELKRGLDDINISDIDLVICPSYLNMEVFKDYKLGAQDLFYEDKGAFTGSISAYDLSLRGIKYSIIGHSERRRYDSLEEINKKVQSALKHSITPILCIGETKIEKEMMKTSEVIRQQLKTALQNIFIDNTSNIIIAYEPVWAINSNISISKEELKDTIIYIKKVLTDLNVNNYKILYGGNVSSININNLSIKDIDGYLLGRVSINTEDLKKLIKCIK